jgi:hypothetical protein
MTHQADGKNHTCYACFSAIVVLFVPIRQSDSREKTKRIPPGKHGASVTGAGRLR